MIEEKKKKVNLDSKYLRVTQFLVVSLQSQGSLGPAGQEVRIWDHHCHKTRLGRTRARVKKPQVGPSVVLPTTSPPPYLQAVSMHKDLSHCIAPHINVLDPLGGDILALGQLEDVLLPVHDLQGAVLVPQTTKSGQIKTSPVCSSPSVRP